LIAGRVCVDADPDTQALVLGELLVTQKHE
jgi:hypothetical protein